jgi:hypothetical protein
MKTTPREARPPAVPATAKQGGKVLERGLWTEPAVWTDRMLTALEEGVKGGVYAFFAAHGYFSLEAAHAAARQPP